MAKENSFGKIKTTLETLVKLFEDFKTDVDADSSELPYRVMHFNDNPLDKAIKAREAEFVALKQENERLRARLELLESGNNADVTQRIDDAVNKSHQIQQLTQKVAEMQAREEKILTAFRKTGRDFREACYLLTGYSIEALRGNIFRLSHMYAEHKDDKLLFEVKRDGTVLLLENEYTGRIQELIRTYLQQADSFPAFLAAITLDLFKASTQTVNMSMTMCANQTVVNTGSL